MYRWLLCARYLRTRYIALASIISVTLGVATLVVVNSVMAGFSAEMHERLHGLASDILIECHASGGLPDPEAQMASIAEVVGDDLVGISCSAHVPAMLAIETGRDIVTRHVNLVGIDAATYDNVSQFDQYLLHPKNQEQVTFDLRESGYGEGREAFPASGWQYRRFRVEEQRRIDDLIQRQERRIAELRALQTPTAAKAIQSATVESQTIESGSAGSGEPSTAPEPAAASTPAFGPSFMNQGGSDLGELANVQKFDPATTQRPGIILGIATCSIRYRNEAGEVADHYHCRPGDDVRMMFPTASDKATVVTQAFTVVDLYESGMSEYDGMFAFCRLEDLQKMRGMIDPATGTRSVTTIQLKLKDDADLNAVRDKLRRHYPPNVFAVDIRTWRDLQGPLLAAVRLETTILNILLFLIIAVAGFGILATFFMIVVEKTRDIGTLKALGASGRGVMSIFVSYGCLLGTVGSLAGVAGGLMFVHYINDIAGVIERVTGQEVFDPTVYYFSEIPTIVHPWTVVWVTAGAIAIAVTASVLPSLRAARMHPVAALRFE